MIKADRRITIDEVAEELGISHERAQSITNDILRYRKVSARWVSRQLTSTHPGTTHGGQPETSRA
ncbi:hypothetical protein TNIN_444041, partial [Trichonephila inaurata madagascariensis]